MPRQAIVVETNPNDVSGGGGCLHSIRTTTDTKGPFVVFPMNDMEDVMSPHVVLCQHCLALIDEALGRDVAAGGETGDVAPADDPVSAEVEALAGIVEATTVAGGTSVDEPKTETPDGDLIEI